MLPCNTPEIIKETLKRNELMLPEGISDEAHANHLPPPHTRIKFLKNFLQEFTKS